MCNAFSCIVTKRKKAVWKFGTDSHDELLRIAKIQDDTKDPKLIEFCRVEISPGLDKYGNRDYLNPNAKCSFKIDMDFTPIWWTEDHEKVAWMAFQKWKKQLDGILVRKPIINPFEIEPPEITQEHIDLLKHWTSVWDSVWTSVGDSVGASVRASVRAYTGSFFALPRSSWEYTENIKTDEYPFQCLVMLWEQGLVPSFDGKKWRLHGGEGARILWVGA